MAQTQSFSFDRYTINEGLSNNSINNVHQTRDGYLWIATKDGLNRFDGQSFKVYKNDSNDSLSLPENYVMSLRESSSGFLWIGTWGGGLCRFNKAEDNFERLNLEGGNDDFIQSIFEDRSGNIWFGTTTGGVYKIGFEQLTGTNIIVPRQINEIIAENVTSIAEDKNNNLWFGTINDGLLKYNPSLNSCVQYLHDGNDKNSLLNNSLWNIFNDSDKYLYLSTNGGIDRFNFITGRFEHHPGVPINEINNLTTTIRQILKDTSGRLWCGTYDFRGLFLFNTNSENSHPFVRFLREEDNPNSLISNRVRCIYEDFHKNLWFGGEDGLNKLPKVHPFIQYKYMPFREAGLGGRVVSSIAGSRDNTIYVGFGEGGFDIIDLETNKIDHLRPHPELNTGLSESEVVTIYEDNTGFIWIGTSMEGLNKYDSNTGRFKQYKNDPADPLSLRSNWVQQILESGDGNFYVGTNDALQKFDRKTERFYDIIPESQINSVRFPAVLQVNSLFEDSEKNIWIGTWLEGLICYKPVENSFIQYLPQADDLSSISANKITTVMEDSKNFIWIGTHSGGINKFDKRNNKFTRYTTKNGLPNDVVFGILEDDSGFIWISTLNGLAKFNPTNETFRIYNVSDGLIHNQFNWRSAYKNKKGEMFFGGINGFIMFTPDSIKVDYNPPPLVITSFKIFDKESLGGKPLESSEEIILQYDQNFFRFEFAALDIAPREKHRFEYMLQGIDPDWVKIGNQNYASYTDIQPGDYKFLVKASNADGIWSKPLSVNLTLLPPFWMTWWFRIFIFALLAAIGFSIYKYRVKQLLEIYKIRFSIASDLHDEIGSNLSSISVESKMLLSSAVINEHEKEQIFDINKTAQETMDAMRDIIWFINPKNNTSEDTIFKMQETASRLLSAIDWSFNPSASVNFNAVNLDVGRNIYLIYKEALANVSKHSNAKTCAINISQNQSYMEIKITDDGIGFNLNQIKNNNGIPNMKQRAAKINAELVIRTSVNSGTEIKLSIPLRPWKNSDILLNKLKKFNIPQTRHL